ncbi:oligopeptide:H+ symporter [Streptomyces sp. NBC_00377]|uniref:peptide MFS transporter n=1 Tax=unclassified Streptomyces TaxID=2593676 RepID=UPI002E2397E1|nr:MULTISPECIES: oligopeptide:H+ symporter [unclassified Streptomyces]
MDTSLTAPPAPAGSRIAGPGRRRGFGTLLAVDLWERFSFFGMAAILVLYLTASKARGGMAMAPQSATAVFAAYMSLSFMAGLPGGWLADRVLGARRAVLLGGSLIACGHLVLAAPWAGSLYPGLLLVVAGTGLVKPAMAAMVAELGGEGPGRREAAFSLFYVCIQVSALVAPVVTGLLAERIAWHLGFAAAAVGMLAGLLQFTLGMRAFGEVGVRPPRPVGRAALAAVLRKVCAVLGLLGAVAAPLAVLGALPVNGVLAVLGLTTVGLPFAYLRALRRRTETPRAAPGTGRGDTAEDGSGRRAEDTDGRTRAGDTVPRAGVRPGTKPGADSDTGTDVHPRTGTGLGTGTRTGECTEEYAGAGTDVYAGAATGSHSGAGTRVHPGADADEYAGAGGQGARARLGAFTAMMAASAAFWMIFAQGGSALSLFADRHTDRALLGFEVPASWFQSLHPLFVLLVAPFLARLRVGAWQRVGTPMKFAGALAAAGTSFVLMAVAARLAEDGPVGPYWLVLVYLLYSCGEIALAPAGLALAAAVAPPGSTSRFLAVNGLFGAVGVVVGGQLYRLTAVLPLSVYFLLVGVFVLGVGTAVALGARSLTRRLAAG